MSATRPVRRRRWLRWLATSGLALVALVCGLACALTCRPFWYRPASIDYNALEADKREFVRVLDEIGAALNRGEPFVLTVSEAQINRWITARHELAPENAFTIDPLERPYVALEEGNRVRLAAQVRRGALRSVLSCRVGVEADGGQLRLTLLGGALGRVPAPGAALERILRDALTANHVRGLDLKGATVQTPNDLVWPNGKRRFRIEGLEIRQHELRAVLRPL